ncbi:MAG: PD-(D/E)XK nuclease domain-containing protein, partial [Planctomycetaceae bacterium]|nr:PD-(D/E)XK nuclease domain-containing protein [Planctomycetaceae bacterium]
GDMIRLHDNMRRQIQSCDAEGLERSLRTMIARVPYQLHIGEEKYYHSLLLVWLYFLGFKVQGEVSTNIGRIDAVWKLSEMIVVAEVKYSADKPLDKLLDEATKQIHERKYYEAYLTETKKIILLSVAFAGKEISCQMETITIDN